MIRANKRRVQKGKEEELSYSADEVVLWKKIFKLPYDSVWYVSTMILHYVIVLFHLYTSVNGFCTLPVYNQFKGVIVIIDIVYAFDIICAFISKHIPNLSVLPINPGLRPIPILIIEIISVLPIEQIVSPEKHAGIYCLLRINRGLRIIRILYFHYRISSLISTQMYVNLCSMCVSILFVVVLNYVVYCNLECMKNSCDYHPCNHLYLLVAIMTKLINTGNSYFDVDVSWEFTTTISCVFVSIFVINVGQAMIIVYFINESAHKIAYVHRFNTTKLRHVLFKSDSELERRSEEVFKLVWRNCNGYDENTDFLRILSPALRNEVLVDVSWPAFQHSGIFRSMDLPFLRHISNYMRQQFLLPGEYIFRRNEWKHKLVYIVSGVIDLLSEEDGESPIISLASGTCMGATTLFMNYKSINSARCKTFCELHILEKKDYMRTYVRFPRRYKALRKHILQRYEFAKTSSNIAKIIQKNLRIIERQTDTYTIFWIKNTLHRLMSKDAESTYRHEFQNIYLLNEVNATHINKLLFSAAYLDLLVITERIQSDTDTIFVRTSFPCILQPMSILIVLWEVLVIFFSIFTSFVIPYFAFVAKISPAWYLPLLYIGTLIYWCDIYIQLSTSIRTRQGVYTKLKQIAVERLQNFGFWIDIFSCIPCEVFSCITLSQITNKMHARMHLNRSLKLWRVFRLFHLWERKFNANIIMIRYLKYTCAFLYLNFIIFSAAYSLKISKEFRNLFFITIQITTGVSLVVENYDTGTVYCTIAYITCSLFVMMFRASISAAWILRNLNLIKIQQVSNDLLTKIEGKRLSWKYDRRITQYLNTQWDDNRCYDFQTKTFSVIYISQIIYNETIDAVVGDDVRSLEFFKMFGNDFILDLCGKLKLMSFPPDEIITRAGDLSTEIIITHKGCCQMFNSKGEVIKIIGASAALNLVDVLFAINNVYTCIARTYCRIFLLDRNDFMQTLLKYPEEMTNFKEIMSSCEDIKEDLIKVLENEDHIQHTNIIQREKCFYHFGYNLKPDSYEEYDYFIPFDRLYPFGWVRYFLQRSTLNPHGKFLLFWEISRCIIAILTSLLYFTLPILSSKQNVWLNILDTMGIIDLYVRLHVGYYDENGLLITHPLMTARHYIKHAFLIDFISIMPLRYFTSLEDQLSYYLLNVNKLLQTHRYLHFIYYLQTNMIKPMNKYFTLCYIPIFLVLANFCGSSVIFNHCQITQYNEKLKDVLDGFSCKEDSLVLHSPLKKPITLWQVHFYGSYIAVSTMTTIGFQGFEIKSILAVYWLSILSALGLYLIVSIFGYIHTLYTFRMAALLETQFAIKHIKKFLEIFNVSKTLRAIVINNYELQWKEQKGQCMHDLMEPFNTGLQGDVLYDFYGRNMYNMSPFKAKTKAFYRNLLLQMRTVIILKGGYLSTINDIENKTYFLTKGKADVLLPDGTKMITLYPGAIFGNLEMLVYARIRISIIAMSHVEIVEIDATKFQKILKFHVKIAKEFNDFKKIHLSYIPSFLSESEIEHMFPRQSAETMQSTYFLKSVDPNSKFILAWKYLNLIFSCYIAILLNFYQFAVLEFAQYMFFIQFVADIVYLGYFIFSDRIAYEDESGIMITDLQMIKANNRKNRITFWISIISLIPADIIIYLMPLDLHLRYVICCTLRLNRALRLHTVFVYFRNKSKMLNVNILNIKMQYIIVWTVLILTGLSTALALSSCYLEINMHPHVPSCTVIQELTSKEKFDMFVKYLFIVASAFSLSAQHNYYPEGTIHLVIFTVLLLIGQSLHITCSCEVFSIIYNMSIKKAQYRSKLERITYFLQTENISSSLLQKIKYFLQLLWSLHEGEIYSHVLHAAPLYLQDAVYNNAYNHILSQNVIFQNVHPDCLRQIIQKLRCRTYFAGDFIQFKGSIDNCMFFVAQGEVGVLFDEYLHKHTYIQVLEQYDSFSILQGLHRTRAHMYSYRSIRRSIILSLNFVHWEHLLKYFPASRKSIQAAAKLYKGL